MFKKKDVKSGETKTLLYQPSWIQNKWWHAYSKGFQGGLGKACILFNDFATNAPRGNLVKDPFQDVGKSEKKKKNSEHETKDYRSTGFGI